MYGLQTALLGHAFGLKVRPTARQDGQKKGSCQPDLLFTGREEALRLVAECASRFWGLKVA